MDLSRDTIYFTLSIGLSVARCNWCHSPKHWHTQVQTNWPPFCTIWWIKYPEWNCLLVYSHFTKFIDKRVLSSIVTHPYVKTGTGHFWTSDGLVFLHGSPSIMRCIQSEHNTEYKGAFPIPMDTGRQTDTRVDGYIENTIIYLSW